MSIRSFRLLTLDWAHMDIIATQITGTVTVWYRWPVESSQMVSNEEFWCFFVVTLKNCCKNGRIFDVLRRHVGNKIISLYNITRHLPKNCLIGQAGYSMLGWYPLAFYVPYSSYQSYHERDIVYGWKFLQYYKIHRIAISFLYMYIHLPHARCWLSLLIG